MGQAGAGPDREIPLRRVLIADDHADTCSLYMEYFEHVGLVVRSAPDAPRAIACARAFDPDVVITDLSMPGGGGLRVLRELRGDPRTARALLVVLTASNDDRLMQRARVAGCDLLITKPSWPGDLLAAVEKAITARTGAEGGGA